MAKAARSADSQSGKTTNQEDTVPKSLSLTTYEPSLGMHRYMTYYDSVFSGFRYITM
jgi:hypothetical protein